ncbi:MAG: DUF1002 domain-containing protein [Candidatus Heteroscillospira sp.]
MKRFLIFVLLISVLMAVPASAAEEGRVVIGADLTEDQVLAVYQDLGLTEQTLEQVKVLTMTNALERRYLEGLVPEEQLGTKSISCVLVAPGEGENSVSVRNTDWCTEAMYLSAMATAGIENLSVQVTAPFTVSGTAAMAGIYMAYEDMTGQTLDEEGKRAGVIDLVTTGELAQELGGHEALTLVTELKLILDETSQLDDEELMRRIDELAGDYKIKLNDYQREKLAEMCRSLEKLDTDALRDKVEGVKDTLEKMGEMKDKAVSFWDAVMAFFKAIGDFIARIAEIFS